jgi:hypothetical protein
MEEFDPSLTEEALLPVPPALPLVVGLALAAGVVAVAVEALATPGSASTD